MIQLLFTILFTEMLIIILFIFKTPLRKLLIMGLDRLKRGRGTLVVKTVCGTLLVVMCSSLFNFFSIHNRGIEDGDLNPTEQVLMAYHLLHATLMGFSLFLALMIDRLHYYIRELRLRRKSMEAVKKLSQGFGDNKSGDAIKALEEETTTLKAKIEQLTLELETKAKEASKGDAKALALKKESEGFLLEYDRLLEENQNLKDQLQSLDHKLSHTDIKKSS